MCILGYKYTQKDAFYRTIEHYAAKPLIEKQTHKMLRYFHKHDRLYQPIVGDLLCFIAPLPTKKVGKGDETNHGCENIF